MVFDFTTEVANVFEVSEGLLPHRWLITEKYTRKKIF